MGYNNDPSTTLADIKRVIQMTEDQHHSVCHK
jgi:cystathionine beta-lyase family protein involved in aluminum resistance